MNLKKILRGLKMGYKKRKLFLEHRKTVGLVVDCSGAHLLIFNFRFNSNFKTT